jgi:hypothetical protein
LLLAIDENLSSSRLFIGFDVDNPIQGQVIPEFLEFLYLIDTAKSDWEQSSRIGFSQGIYWEWSSNGEE